MAAQTLRLPQIERFDEAKQVNVTVLQTYCLTTLATNAFLGVLITSK